MSQELSEWASFVEQFAYPHRCLSVGDVWIGSGIPATFAFLFGRARAGTAADASLRFVLVRAFALVPAPVGEAHGPGTVAVRSTGVSVTDGSPRPSRSIACAMLSCASGAAADGTSGATTTFCQRKVCSAGALPRRFLEGDTAGATRPRGGEGRGAGFGLVGDGNARMG